MADIEWRQVDDSTNDWEYRFAKVEAQREIAEQLNRMNDNIEKIIESGVSDEDKDKD